MYGENNRNSNIYLLLNNLGEQVWINSNAKLTAIENSSFQSVVQFKKQPGIQVDTFPVWTLDGSSCPIFAYILEGQDASLSFPPGCS